MKSLRVITLSIAVLIIITWLGGVMVQKGAKPFRLKEPRITPLTEQEWNDDQAKVLEPRKRKDGTVLNVFATLGKHPLLLDRWMKFGFYVLGDQTLPARDREILILRIGWLCQAKYEFGQHTLAGKSVGLTDDEILRITKGPDEPGWNKFDSALVRAADELYYDAIISNATWKALSERYSEKQLMDVIATVGQYNLVSWYLNSCGVQLEEGVPGFPEGSKK